MMMTVCDWALLGIPTMAASSIVEAVRMVGTVCLILVHLLLPIPRF
jgi:hypothetical protein